MKLNKKIGLLSVAVLSLGVLLATAGTASASYSIVNSPGNGSGDGSTVFTYNDVNSNGLLLNSGSAYGTASAVVDTSQGIQPAEFGSFIFTSDPSANGTGTFTDYTNTSTILFAGTYSGLTLSTNGPTSEQYAIANVAYTYLDETNVTGDGYYGSLGVTLNGLATPGPTGDSTAKSYGTSFVLANPTGTPSTPEPSSLLAIGIATLGLGGLLMFRKKSVSTLS